MNKLQFTIEEALIECDAMVNSYAKKYHYVGNEEDIKQELRMAIMNAYEKYDSIKNDNFKAYVTLWFKYYMQQYYNNNHYSVSLTRNILDKRKAINEAIEELGGNTSYDDISKKTGYSIKQISEALADYSTVALDKPHENNENDATMLDTVTSHYQGPAESFERLCKYDTIMKSMKKYLNENEIYVLTHKAGYYCDKLTNEEIGQALGVKHQRVSAIYQTASKKMRAHESELYLFRVFFNYKLAMIIFKLQDMPML